MPASEQRSTESADCGDVAQRAGWSTSLRQAIRSREELIRELGLNESGRSAGGRVETDFPVLVPRSYLARMKRADWDDPLLKQVVPQEAENDVVSGFSPDAVGDQDAKLTPGLIQKYRGRVLLIAAGSCAVNCRYCFRRHYPYGDDPRRLSDWQPALDAIAADSTVHEVILSGGDPLMLTDTRLSELVALLAEIPHVRRLRVHTRLPIVLPDRVTDRLVEMFAPRLADGGGPRRLRTWFVVHSNHANELVGDCADGLDRLVASGIPVLNQAVLLRGVNDSVDAMANLCERLIDLGVQPYYLHLLDRVAGTAHFEVVEDAAVEIIEAVRERLPGYAVPSLVREIAGMASKTPVQMANPV